MATKLGAAGVRTELKDSSQYTVIENPNAIGAIVGFAPQGELNKVTKLTNTAAMDKTFGIGFNNWKYNQGLYAARAVLDAGGFVQYVRPYGEEIDMSDARKRDLKTDCFVVSFDRKAAQQAAGKQNSINIEYFAATRYKSDGAAGYGVTRKINNVAETVSSGSNVDFKVFADDGFKDSEKARGDGDAVLFAIMGADPSSARRAVTTYDIVGSPDDLKDRDPDTFRVVLAVNPGFIIGDTVYGPADTNTKTFCKFIVSGIDGKTVDITAADKATHEACMMGYKPASVLMFSPEDAITDDDADYLTVKTAVTGRGAKLFSSLRIDGAGIKKLATETPNGDFFTVRDQKNAVVDVRVANGIYGTLPDNTFSGAVVGEPVSIDPIQGVCNADVITLNWDYDGAIHTGTFIYAVTAVDENGNATAAQLYLEESAWYAEDLEDTTKISNIVVYNLPSGWYSEHDYVTLTVPTKGDDEEYESISYLTRFRDALVAAFTGSRLGYATAVVTNDLNTTNDISNTDSAFMKPKDFIAGKTKVLKVVPGAAFDYNVGDIVAIVRGSSETERDSKTDPIAFGGKNILKLSTVTAINGFTNEVTIKDAIDSEFVDTVIDAEDGIFKTDYRQLQLLNLSSTNKTVYTAMSSDTVDCFDEGIATQFGTEGSMEFVSTKEYKVGSIVKVKSVIDGEDVWYSTTIASCEGVVGTTTDYHYTLGIVAPEGATGDIEIFTGETKTGAILDFYIIGNYDVTVNSQIQKTTLPVAAGADGDVLGVFTFQPSKKDSACIKQTEKVLRDSDIGANFVGLGLANLRYEDINFTGVTEKVYDLTTEGEAVARLYMSCTYRYNGKVYNFDGTVVEYVHNETQLFIGDAADSEFEGSGLKFILNESGILEAFLEDESWDLSETIVDGVPTSSVTAVSFNTKDPAVIWNAIWTYDPKNNNNTTTLSTAYSLFLDKDRADQTFFVAAGNDINNFGWPGRETLNTTVIQAILNICELRKDCFALFDGVAEQNIDNALKKDVVRFPATLGRWGAIYDARPIFYDSMITRRNVEIAPSIAMASLITANRSGSIYWYVPAGKDTGVVPSAWCTRVKYERKFNIPEDPDSDIARLSDAHVNPFRTNDDGIFCWGDFTMQMEDSAFNQIHVAMLIAGIHKTFYKYLDGKVFRLNTAALRSQISSDLQAKLNMMRDSNPSAFYDAVAICDDTNNTPDVIDQNKLYVDLKLKPTKSTRYIYLRTEVLATSSGNSITISNV